MRRVVKIRSLGASAGCSITGTDDESILKTTVACISGLLQENPALAAKLGVFGGKSTLKRWQLRGLPKLQLRIQCGLGFLLIFSQMLPRKRG